MANDDASALDFSAMVPSRRFGVYPPPLADVSSFDVASKKLVSGLETVTSIAKGLGYASSGSFTASWKRLTGHTPTAWASLPVKKRRAMAAQVRAKIEAAAAAEPEAATS